MRPNNIEATRLEERDAFINGLERWEQEASQGEKRREAKDRIIQAYDNDSTELTLSVLKLKTLPSEIGKLVQLQEIHLSINELTTLPSEIGDLTKLKKIYLFDNKLRVLPAEIGNLTQLHILRLDHNKLINLPTEIGNLTQLEDLNLQNNNLEILPSDIGNLTQLKKLDLSSNKLRPLTSEIFNLTQLQELSLAYNELTTLPSEISNLTQLKELQLCHNRLNTIPPEINNLRKLKKLYLYENRITYLPTELATLTQLELLRLEKNKLTSLPSEIANLTRLEDLRLSDNLLTSLPDSLLTSHSHLRTFIVYLERNRITAPELARMNHLIATSRSQLNVNASIYEPPVIRHSNIESSLAHHGVEITDFLNSTSEEFKTFIQQCSRTKGWRDNPIKMTQSLVNIINAMRENDVKKGFCEALAHDVSTTCGDRVALTLALMQIKIEFPNINSLADLNLSELFDASKLDAISQILLQEAEEKVVQIANSGGILEEIEVYLAYLELVKEFGFNLDSIQGLYTNTAISGVSHNDLDQAREALNNPGIDHITAQHLYLDSELKLHPEIQEIITEVGQRDEFDYDQTSEENDLEYQNRLSRLKISYETAVIATILEQAIRSNSLLISEPPQLDEEANFNSIELEDLELQNHEDEHETNQPTTITAPFYSRIIGRIFNRNQTVQRAENISEAPNTTNQSRSCLPLFRRTRQIHPGSQANNGENER